MKQIYKTKTVVIRKVMTIALMTMISTVVHAQGDVSVKEFRLDPTDLTAASHETKDSKGNSCALLKVMVIGRNVNFNSSNLVHTESKGHNEYWVWLSPGAKSVLIKPGSYSPVEVVFSQHDPYSAALKSKHTYVLTLSVQKTTGSKVNVTFRSDVADFVMEIDGYTVDSELHTLSMTHGVHRVKVRARGYEDYIDEFELNSLSPSAIDYTFSLTPTPTEGEAQARMAAEYMQDSNFTRAFELYQMAARNGSTAGQNGLGEMYYYGNGVAKNKEEAAKWFQLAADKEMPEALCNLGNMYHKGEGGIKKDDSKAVQLFRKAGDMGYAEAWFRLGSEFSYGDSKVRNFYRKGAKLGHAGCQSGIAWYYLSEFYEYDEALRWYTMAANQGWPMAQYNIGVMYEKGLGMDKDLQKAFSMYLAAASNGHKRKEGSARRAARMASLKIAQMYEKGLGVEKDIDNAILWYAFSLSQGNTDAKEGYTRLVASRN